MNPRRLFLATALLLLFSREVIAQPGGDSSRFSPFSTCEYASHEAEEVFLGKVISLEEVPYPYPRSGRVAWWKATVSVETILKGHVSQTQEVYLPKYSFDHDFQIKGKKYIFLVNRISDSSFTGLFSDKWSTPVDEISANELQKLLVAIHSILRGVPEPRIIGTVIEGDWNGRLSSNPAHIRPLSGIVVMAEGRDGKKFKTETDVAGRFQFKTLPTGTNPQKDHRYFPPDSKFEDLPRDTYAVYPILMNKMDISLENVRVGPGERIYIQLGTVLCSARVTFTVEPASPK
jgi:hypothetical protein